MVLGKRSVTVVVVCACVMLTGYSVSGYCQKTPETSHGTAVQTPSDNQQPPVSLRDIRLGLEVVADLSVDPLVYMGSCPGLFTLKGKISVNKPVTLHYRFIGAGLPPSLAKPLTFDGPGSKEVTETRELGSALSSPTFRRSAVLQVVWPRKADSNVVDFSGTCTNTGQPGTPGSSLQQIEKGVQPGPQGEQAKGVFPLPEIGPPQGQAQAGPNASEAAPKTPEPGVFPLPSINPDGPAK
jgi:hypothetical protein